MGFFSLFALLCKPNLMLSSVVIYITVNRAVNRGVGQKG